MDHFVDPFQFSVCVCVWSISFYVRIGFPSSTTVPVDLEAELSAQLVDLAEEISRMEELLVELQSKRQMQLRLIATRWNRENCGTLINWI